MASRTEQCGINPVMARSQEGKDVYYTSSSTTTTTTTMRQKKQSEHQSSASRNQEKRKYPEHSSIIAATTFKRSRQQSEVPSNHQQLLHQRTLDGFVKSPAKIASRPYSSPPSETSRVEVVSNTGSIEAATTTTTPIDVIDLLSSDDDEDELVPIQKRDAATMERPIRQQKQHSVANNSSERPQMRQRSGVAAVKHSQNNVSSPKQQHQQQYRFKTKSLSQPRVDRSIARSRVVVDVLASDDDDVKLPAVNSRHRSTQQQSSIPSAVKNHAPSRKWTGESSTQQPRGLKPLNPLSSQPIPRVNRRGGSRNVIDVLSSSDDDDSDDDVKLPAVNRPNELPAERQSLQHDSLATGTMKHVPACQKLEGDSIARQQEPHVNNQIFSKKQSSPLSHPGSHAAAASPTSEAQSSNSCTAFTDSLTLAQHLQAEFSLPPPPIDDNSCRLYTAEEFKSMWNKVEVNIGFTTEELEDGKLVRKANKTISRQDSTEQEKAQYGRLLFEATDKVLTDVLDVRESDVFLDIGHGIGNTVNQAVFTKGCRGRGIEVVGDRHLLAMQYTKDLDGQHKRDEEHNDVHRPIGHIRFREGRFEEPVHRDFLTKVEGGVIKAMCNNFNGVFGDRCAKATKDSLIYTLDNHLAALLAHMKPGSVLATLHSLGQYLGPSMSEVKEARAKHSLQSNNDALSSFYEVTEFDIGDATKSVSWSANSGTKNRITVYKYTRLDQGAATDRPVMLCTNPQCEAAIQARPFVVTKFHVIAGENRLLMSAFCPDCLVTESSKRSRKAIKYYE